MSEDFIPRTRILYIRHPRLSEIPEALRLNQDEWWETTAMLADTTLMTKDFDLDDVCDTVQPDLIIYESPGLDTADVKIANWSAHPHIPRIAFFMQDPQDGARIPFLRLVEKLDIRWWFTHLGESFIRQSPEFADRMFSVSLLVDDRLFHDRALPKDIPVSVMGGLISPKFYHWRASTVPQLFDHFSTMVYTHPGYQHPVPAYKFAVMGEDYAKALSRSYFSVADSTRLDYLVRKHLEIPAAGSVLVAPDTAVLRPYGFRDMENCVLGEGKELIGKMAAVLEHPALYEIIRKNGHDLVHRRYTRGNWRWFLDFLLCLRGLGPGETVQQQGILGRFAAVPDTGRVPAISGPIADSDFSRAMKRAWHLIITGDSPQAQAILAEVASWVAHMSEPYLLLALCSMLQGNLAEARDFLLTPLTIRRQRNRTEELDPEEIAWMLILGSLSGEQALYDAAFRAAAGVEHLSLRRVGWLLTAGIDIGAIPDNVQRRQTGDVTSIHWVSQSDIALWLGLVTRIFQANGRA